jgi:hypothetical protein
MKSLVEFILIAFAFGCLLFVVKDFVIAVVILLAILGILSVF